MKVEIWSDVVCPWCYVGKRRFESSLAQFAHRDEVEVLWRSFELDPTAPPVREGDPTQRLAAKYGMTVEQTLASQDRIAEAAAAEGLGFRLRATRSGNTFDAHRLIHFAADRGLQDAVKERLLSAYLCEEQAIGDRETLVLAAIKAGLNGDEAREVLEAGIYADAVQADEAEGAALGINAVPFFVIDRKYGISGAQDPETILAVLNRAWDERTPLQLVPTNGAEGACIGDTCAI